MRWIDRKIDEFIRRVRDNPNPAQSPITVGPPNDPTYHRYFVFRRNRWLNFYLHCFHHDDEEHLHDHRAFNISILLQGSYFEERFLWSPVEGYALPPTDRRTVRRLMVRFPSTPHRVVLHRVQGRPVPVWSLFIKLPDVRDWGFWCPGNSSARWVPWQRYAATNNPNDPRYGQPGAGCGG